MSAETSIPNVAMRGLTPERWLSADPLGEVGGMNLYAYVGGNPLIWCDILGLKLSTSDKKLADLVARLRKLDARLESLVSALENSPYQNYITTPVAPDEPYSCSDAGNPKQAENEKNGVGIGATIYVNPDTKIKSKYQDIIMMPEEILAHEMMHAYDTNKGIIQRVPTAEGDVEPSEKRAISIQNVVRKIQQPNAPLRDNYAGRKFKDYGSEHCPIK